MNPLVIEYIQLTNQISHKYQEIEELRQKRNQIEANVFQFATENQLLNKTMKTSSGKKYVFKERTHFECLTQKFLKKALLSFFRKVPPVPPTAEAIFQHILQERTFQRIIELLGK